MRTRKSRAYVYFFGLLCVLVETSATPTCSPSFKFYVNRIAATCTSSAAIPLNVQGTFLGYDRGAPASGSEMVSLVREASCVPQLETCQSIFSNSQNATSFSSGWMRAVPPGFKAFNSSSTTERLLNSSDSDQAILTMKAGCYSFCWANNPAVWTNMGIVIKAQTDIIGLEINGVRHANGLRVAIPRWYTAATAALPHRLNVTIPIRSAPLGNRKSCDCLALDAVLVSLFSVL
jgi:hypothetical protein